MVECKICKRKFKSITHMHLKTHGVTIEEYLKKFKLSQDMLTSKELREKWSKSRKGIINLGDMNVAKRPEVRNKISNAVKKLWEKGAYKDRINGMTGKFKELCPGYKPENHTITYMAENNWSKFLSGFQTIKQCNRCGSTERKINIHHIDEDHENFLPSNLEPLCIPCHGNFHYECNKQPFISITKTFDIAAAHFLPYYEGLCSNIHGHSWVLEITLKKRIDKKTGMVMDFSILKKIVTDHIINKFDHDIINNYIQNPTAENMVVFIWEVLMFDALLKGIESIVLWESKTSYCRLTKYGMLSIFKSNIEDYMGLYGLDKKRK